MSESAVKQEIVHYFEKDRKGGYICQVEKNEETCKAKLGPKKYNLKRHLERFHPELYKHHVAAEQAQTKQSDATCSAAANKQQPTSNFFRNEKLTLSMTKKKFKRHLVQLIVDNGVAIRVLS